MAGVREEWYQSEGAVTLGFLYRGVQGDSICVEHSEGTVTVRFALHDGTPHERVIEPHAPVSAATASATPARVEVRMQKSVAAHWPALEASAPAMAQSSVHSSAPAYPTSARARHDWAAVEREADAQAAEAAGVDAFFHKLYAGADEDTRRAMVKSYVESKGTVLSTNWADVGARRVDTARPPGFDVSGK